MHTWVDLKVSVHLFYHDIHTKILNGGNKDEEVCGAAGGRGLNKVSILMKLWQNINLDH